MQQIGIYFVSKSGSFLEVKTSIQTISFLKMTRFVDTLNVFLMCFFFFLKMSPNLIVSMFVMINRVVMDLCFYKEMGQSKVIQQTDLLEDFQ